jgi:hypothetical protein
MITRRPELVHFPSAERRLEHDRPLKIGAVLVVYSLDLEVRLEMVLEVDNESVKAREPDRGKVHFSAELTSPSRCLAASERGLVREHDILVDPNLVGRRPSMELVQERCKTTYGSSLRSLKVLFEVHGRAGRFVCFWSRPFGFSSSECA